MVNFIWVKIKSYIRDVFNRIFFARLSYAQEGEDLIVDRLLESKQDGFYIEVGAHDPFRFSNTYLFYKKKWRGICIDPLPKAAKRFRKWRPRDKFIEMGVAQLPSKLTYFLFADGALNTFDAKIAARYSAGPSKLLGTKDVYVDSLANICAKNEVPKNIDFLSVDAEGLDLEILKSNDWEKYQPTVIIAEIMHHGLFSIETDETVKFLQSKGYGPLARTGQSVIFMRELGAR